MPDYTGPTQPFAGGGMVQENFRAMVDHVLSYNPDASPGLVKRRLNARLRMVEDRRMWGGLMVRGELYIPAAYSTGSVQTTRGSHVVTGTSTVWPTNDVVNTTLSGAITLTNELQDITPASMTNIEPGDWLTLDAAGASPGGANKEFLLVVSTTSNTFKAKPTKTHSAGEVVWKSSLARRQFRLGTTSPFYNIRGVTGGQELQLDQPWNHASAAAGSAYQIITAYVTLGQTLRMIWSALNTSQGWRLKLDLPQEVANVYDTWRQTTGWAYAMLSYAPDEIGRFQYELYPTPSMEQGIPYLALRTVPDMSDDEDTPPPAIPSHMLVHGALADIMVWNRKSAYYDPAVAKAFAIQFERDLIAAALADDSIYMQNLQWAYSKYPYTQHGAAYWQSHED